MALAGSLQRRAVLNHHAGKRSALKGARSVWKGGKTVKSYLSLLLRLFIRGKKSPLAGVLGVALTSPWKGGSHAYPMRETVQSAEVPGWADAGGDGEPSRPVSHTGRGGAAARDDDAQGGQDPWH